MLKYIAKLLRHVLRLIEKFQKKPHNGPSYYRDDIAKRDALLRDLYKKIEAGQTWLESIHTPESANHGERVAEYAYVASLLDGLAPSSILDVGCVLNNPVIADFVTPRSHIYFLNPALETVHYQNYGYFKSPLSKWHAPLTFPLVTCFSTIEHIGFDNTRYGVNEVDHGWDWPRCIEEVVKSIEMLLTIVEPGGTLVASCPYGVEEYVLMPPESGVRTAQILHMGHVEALQKAFGARLEIITLRLSEFGWESCLPDDEFQPYGAIGPGASGLILIVGKGA
jgi:hypothetical protein